jgi:hypothetical protein
MSAKRRRVPTLRLAGPLLMQKFERTADRTCALDYIATAFMFELKQETYWLMQQIWTMMLS